MKASEQVTMTARTVDTMTIETLMSIRRPRKITTHASAIANSTGDTSAKLLKTDTTLTAMAGGITVVTIATDTPTATKTITERDVTGTGMAMAITVAHFSFDKRL